jgi:hypothetical protein
LGNNKIGSSWFYIIRASRWKLFLGNWSFGVLEEWGMIVESLEYKRERKEWTDHLIVKESNAIYEIE